MFRFRFLWPVVLGSLCVVALCAVIAVSLFRQQASASGDLRVHVAAHRTATELEECIRELITFTDLQANEKEVAALHDRATSLLGKISQLADHPEERNWSKRLNAAFARYHANWRTEAKHLETDVLMLCQDFEVFIGRLVEESAEAHGDLLRQLAWGMAAIGALGGVAGVVFGFGLARGLSRSIRRLQVQIRDAAGKLDDRVSEIVLTGDDDLAGLHHDIDRLSERIGLVVEQLRQRDREVLRAEQLAAVGQLAAGVAHEIRNPLTGIKMLIQAELEDSSVGGMPREDLTVIEAEVRRLERSLQSFLDFARPPRLERQPAELVGLVRSVLGLMRGRAEKQGVIVRLRSPANDLTVTADPEQFRQVVVNLTMNALDAMPNGGELVVTVEPSLNGGVNVEIADTGAGIAVEMLGRLFQPFASTKDTGLGLGLVTSRRIVEDHGGTVVAGNRPSGGAVFIAHFPRGNA